LRDLLSKILIDIEDILIEISVPLYLNTIKILMAISGWITALPLTLFFSMRCAEEHPRIFLVRLGQAGKHPALFAGFLDRVVRFLQSRRCV
jgi:hypothetical protein